jgi:hypothetical protein
MKYNTRIFGIRMRFNCFFRAFLGRFLITACLVLSISTAQAHPIEFHMQPMEAADVERVITSLERIADELNAAGKQNTLRMPENSLGISAMPGVLQGALMEADEVTTVDSPSLLRAITAAGYADSYYVVEQWEGEAERVVETYEVLKRGLSMDRIYKGYADLEAQRTNFSEEVAAQSERILVREHEMVRTTAKDLDLVSVYLPRLDVLVARLGIEVARD